MSEQVNLFDIEIERNVSVPMRDGVKLRTHVYHPVGNGRWPVILMRFVVDPDDEEYVKMGTYFSRRGYAFVYNAVRGVAGSGGDFFPLVDEAWGANQDGYDTIEWAGKQRWSNGKVGLLGTSYAAFNQYTTAPTRPPSLKACMPFYGSSSGREIVCPDGPYRLEEHRGWALWMAMNCLDSEVAPEAREQVRTRLVAAKEHPESWVWHLPVTECPQLDGMSPWHDEHLRHMADLDWWAQTDATKQFGEIDVPMLHVAGWYDLYLNGTLEHFSGLVENGRTATCRNGQCVVVGPWAHGGCSVPKSPPPLDFGQQAMIDFNGLALRWFDHWLKDADNGLAEEPPVSLFLMGENRWLEMDEWPPADVAHTPIYLRHGTGQNDMSLNNGHLTFEPPTTDEQPDPYSYDPEEPIVGHHLSGHWLEIDQREREGLMLTYSSEVLRDSVTIVGPVRATLFASSSARDTDFIVRLCNVWPDGRSVRICDGVVRARYRESVERETLMQPGEVYRFDIDMTATAHTFLPGHRIRVHVTSSDFPRYDRNLNTGEPFGTEISGHVAENTVYHDVERPSHVVLPIFTAANR